MKVRLQADNDLDFLIVTANGHLDSRIDFQSAHQAGLHGRTDPEVLAIRARDNRIVVSHDRRTMPKHFGDFIENTPSPGLIVGQQKARHCEIRGVAAPHLGSQRSRRISEHHLPNL
jgi:hypothetical protein